METCKRKNVSEKMKVFSPGSPDSSYIDITEWVNGEGWTIDINGKIMELSWDDLDAINYLVNYMRYYDRNR